MSGATVRAGDQFVIPGVYRKPGVVLAQRHFGFLASLRAAVGFDLVVTSGDRTVVEQAAEMRKDLDLYGVDHLYDLYRRDDLVAEILAGHDAAGEAGMVAALVAQVARGERISNHLAGAAVDLRTQGLSSVQRSKVVDAIRTLGGNALDEGDHIHAGGIGAAFALLSPASLAIAAALGVYLLASGE